MSVGAAFVEDVGALNLRRMNELLWKKLRPGLKPALDDYLASIDTIYSIGLYLKEVSQVLR